MNSTVNLSMRRLKRVPSDNGLTYTLETATEQKKDNLLCNFCGWRDVGGPGTKCLKYRTLARYQKKGVGLLVRTCETFQPTLTFRMTKAMEGGFQGEFNTFRLGSTWYNRVSPGTVCSLYDVGKSEVFGKAYVTETFNGDMTEMCHDHAWENHLFVGYDKIAAAEKMEDAMRKAYGHIMDHRNNTLCTVIKMRRL